MPGVIMPMTSSCANYLFVSSYDRKNYDFSVAFEYMTRDRYGVNEDIVEKVGINVWEHKYGLGS